MVRAGLQGERRMRERSLIRCIESVAIMQYRKTNDKWWLKVAVAATKKLNEKGEEYEISKKEKRRTNY